MEAYEDGRVYRALDALGDSGRLGVLASYEEGRKFVVLALEDGEDPAAVARNLGCYPLHCGLCGDLFLKKDELEAEASVAADVHDA